MNVSAVTVSYRTGPRLRDCLYGLKADPEIDEIIIVDNGNAETEADFIQRFVADTPKAKYVPTGTNLGFGRACNIGAAEAGGTHLLIINPDAVVRWKSVSAMVQAGEGLPHPWIVGGKIFGLDGVEQRGGRRHILTLPRALGLAKWTLETDPVPQTPIRVGAISGGFFLMPKADFIGLDGFDETYFLHVEDLDLCRRVGDAGGAVVYQPKAAALHYGSTADAPSIFVETHKAAGLKYYFTKFARGPLSWLGAHTLGSLIALMVVSRARRNAGFPKS